MTAEERRAAARERVKRWKKDHPKSIRDQWARRYERKKAVETSERKEQVAQRVKKEPMLPTSYGETHYEDMALVEGDPEVVRANARVVARRTGRAIPAGLMEPKQKGGRDEDMGEVGERSVSEKGGERAPQTAEEQRVETWIKKRTAKGVSVPPLRV